MEDDIFTDPKAVNIWKEAQTYCKSHGLKLEMGMECYILLDENDKLVQCVNTTGEAKFIATAYSIKEA